MRVLKYLRWILKGRPSIQYDGVTCGCCGAWVKKKFGVPEYMSEGRWDTVGLYGVCVKICR